MNRFEQPDAAAVPTAKPSVRQTLACPEPNLGNPRGQVMSDTKDRAAGGNRQAAEPPARTDVPSPTGPLACAPAPIDTAPPTPEPAWPGVAAIVAGLLPATTSRRTSQVGLLEAWTVHVIAVIMAPIVVMLLVSWAHGAPAIARVVAIPAESYRRAPVLFIGSSLAWLVGIETAFAIAALPAAIWGALPDEPMRRSLRWGLTRAWLWTGQVLWAVLLIGLLVTWLSLAGQRDGWDWYGTPWYVRRSDDILALAFCAATIWLYCGLLRWAGIRRPAQTPARTPRCETCGYCLLSIAFEGRCPECGQPAAASLDPGNRCGAPWERRGRTGLAGAYLETASAAIRYPRQLARNLRLKSEPRHARLFLLLSLGITFAVSYLGLLACYVANTGEWPTGADDLFVFPGVLAVAMVETGALATLTVLASGLVGVAFRLRHGTNLLAGTTQLACYLSAWFPIWAAVLFLAYAIGAAVDADPIALGDRLGLPPLLSAACVSYGPHLTFGVFYTLLLARGVQALRYANY